MFHVMFGIKEKKRKLDLNPSKSNENINLVSELMGRRQRHLD